jgi:kynureninase
MLRPGALSNGVRVATLADSRCEFPLLDRYVYLNSSVTGATPRAAQQVLEDYWRTVEGWRDDVWPYWWNDLETYTGEIAALIGAPAGSVTCDTNLSTLLARVMSAFDFRARPRIITSDLEFPSVPYVLHSFARHGAELTVVPSRDGISIDVDAIVESIDARTQLVCLSHTTFGTGALVDVAPIVSRARDVGALVALDAYQSIGAVPVDVLNLNVDFVLGGAHKWLCGSYDSAFLYVRPSLDFTPAAASWTASPSRVASDPARAWAANARRFASGTPGVLPSLMSRPGLAIVRAVGVDTIRALSLERTNRIIAAADRANLGVATPRHPNRRGAIVTLRFPGDAAVAHRLIEQGFVCSYRGGIRVAPHFYNTDEEIDCFMDELVDMVRTS